MRPGSDFGLIADNLLKIRTVDDCRLVEARKLIATPTCPDVMPLFPWISITWVRLPRSINHLPGKS